MGVCSDTWIRRMATEYRMIEPFVDGQIREGLFLWLSSYGYDIRVTDGSRFSPMFIRRWWIPSTLTPTLFVDFQGRYVCYSAKLLCVGAHGGVFSHSRNVITVCLGKSTYALRPDCECDAL